MPIYYDILGVKKNASEKEIKAAYRELIKQYHPDINPNQAEALKHTQLINEAYSILKNPVKRYEYDNSLSLQEKSETAETFTYEDETRQPRFPQIRCEKCGRQDTTLKVTIFLRVVSFIVMTSKRGWGHILCSRCRIKYSLLFNLQVWLLGWWGFPWGPIYTIEALFTNFLGGIQPRENNADMFALLAYNFYQQNRFGEAYRILLESHKMKPTKERKKFLDYLSYCSPEKTSRSFFDRVFSLNPAWYNTPLLAILILVSYLFITSLNWNDERHFNTQYTSIYPTQLQKINAPERDFADLAETIGIDIDDFDNSVNKCNQEIKSVASYIKSKATMIRKTYEGSRTIYNYEFDRSKLNELVIHKYAESIRNEAYKSLNIMQSISFSDRFSLEEKKEKWNKLQIYLKQQLEFMTLSLFNVSLLEVSITFMKEFNKGFVSSITFESVKLIQEQPIFQNWLSKRNQSNHYFNLLVLLEKFKRNQNALIILDRELRLIESTLQSEKSTLNNLEKNLEYYESISLHDKYNSLVPQYNSLLKSIQNNIDKYNNLVLRHNELVKSLDINEVDKAFNNCLDTALIFPEFEKVDFNIAR